MALDDKVYVVIGGEIFKGRIDGRLYDINRGYESIDIEPQYKVSVIKSAAMFSTYKDGEVRVYQENELFETKEAAEAAIKDAEDKKKAADDVSFLIKEDNSWYMSTSSVVGSGGLTMTVNSN